MKRNVWIKRIIDIMIIGTVFAGAYFFLSKLTVLKSDTGTTQMMDLYAQKENTVDVVFLGSSFVGMDIDEATLWNEYGIASFCPWGSEQAFWGSYFTLMETLKYQNPKAVVLECGSVYHEEYQEPERQSVNLSGMKLSANKIRAVQNSSPVDLWDDMLLLLPMFHDRLLDLTEQDYAYLSGTGDINQKGFFDLGMESNGETRNFNVRTCESVEPISEKSEQYLRKIVETCIDKQICIILLQNPCTIRDRDPKYNYVSMIADEYGVPCINFNSPEYDLGIDNEDFYDNSHLNKRGGRILTKALAEEMKRYVTLPDHRNDPDYRSWAVCSAMGNATCLRSITDYDRYMEEAERDGFFVAITEVRDGKATYSIRDFSMDDTYTLIGNENTNYMYDHAGHVFTADLQNPDRIWVRYDGEAVADVKIDEKVIVVYDQYVDSVVDVAFVRKDLYGHTVMQHSERY